TMLLRLIGVLMLIKQSSASFCGSSAVPFSFEAMPDGQPVLGCARPNCFGWVEGGMAADGHFYRINRRPDGFFRNEDEPSSSRGSRLNRLQQHAVECEESFQSDTCASDNQWVAGIAPLLNVTAFPIVLQCCTFEPLRLSSNRGVATVKPGQIVIGGEVLNNEAFDYISNVEKGINIDGTVTYKVGMRRFYCPPPVEAVPELVTIKPMGNSVQDYRRAPNRAYQAPNVPVNQPIPTNAVDGEDVVVEEVVAQEGVEVPDTTEESDEEPVRVITGEEKRLDDLKVNDWVQTLKGAEISTEELSRVAVLAEKVAEGDCLYQVVEDDHVRTTRVTKVSRVIETGIYSPMTSNGRTFMAENRPKCGWEIVEDMLTISIP
ncbi:hypothetical protein TELCIR_08261, partial [Teladorsagia circumcincta]